MIKPGHIEIRDNKIIFVYHELPKLDESLYDEKFGFEDAYYEDLDKYQASKREVETSNVINVSLNDCCKWKVYIEGKYPASIIINNQPCEAEVTDNKAIITKIL
ncbi:hypothetical protein ES704_03651 [subsurface metagenome]|jgi:hypothetical protein